MKATSLADRPAFDRHVPIPARGPSAVHDPSRAYPVHIKTHTLAQCLQMMEVGESFLMSNYATTSINYARKRHGRVYTRERQPDGTVRVWRVS